MLAECPLPLEQCPYIKPGGRSRPKKGDGKNGCRYLFEAIESHAGDGVDFVTVHCGVTRSAIARLKQQTSGDVVSRVALF